MALPGAAPCQCLTLAGQMTTSPALISWMGLPHSWVRPTPAVTMSTCPTGWICQWEREPGSKVTLPPLERIGGVDKARAVQMALRTLAPHVILLDELGSLEETMALEQGFFSGVDFIASIHAPDAAQAQCRPQVQALLQRGMLRQLVILAGRETPGCIREVCAV